MTFRTFLPAAWETNRAPLRGALPPAGGQITLCSPVMWFRMHLSGSETQILQMYSQGESPPGGLTLRAKL